MNLQTLLASVPIEAFFQDHFCRFPLAMKGTATNFCPLANWQLLDQILGQPEVDVMVVRQGEQYSGPPPRSVAGAQELSRAGYTILVRHAERHDPRLQELAAAFAADCLANTDIHIYATPPGTHGFSWHYDAEDVFIVQTTGRKRYALRKNTVHPWPLVETIPQDMRYESEKTLVMYAELCAGDWLYIPCGYWHKAEVLESSDVAFSLAIGTMSPTAIDLYDFLRRRLMDSLVWRCRLPVTSHVAGPEFHEAFRVLTEGLARDFRSAICDERTWQDFLAQRRLARSPPSG